MISLFEFFFKFKVNLRRYKKHSYFFEQQIRIYLFDVNMFGHGLCILLKFFHIYSI